jgi:hypothetical protein
MLLGASYSAVYYRNSDSETALAASALRTSSGVVTVDVPLPSTDWLDKLRLSKTWADDAQVGYACRHCTALYYTILLCTLSETARIRLCNALSHMP